jgi:flagellum-specific peptidoglycan hydrolase FlgJ
MNQTQKDFVAAIAPAAQASMALTGIPASFVVADAALEVGWGLHVPGMNLFGVKADASWTGSTIQKLTKEVIDGKTVVIPGRFRSYKSWEESINDHAKFLQTQPRYRPAFSHIDGEGFATAVAEAHYATDPNYAAKIIAIIRSCNLTQFDKGIS